MVQQMAQQLENNSTRNANPAIQLYVGGHCASVHRQPFDLAGKRMFTAAHPPRYGTIDLANLRGIVDSGAFTDINRDSRLTYKQALDRQLEFELRASLAWKAIEQLGCAWQGYAFVSYDRLIDEVKKSDVRGGKVKQRWQWDVAESAMVETIEAARYLASQRQRLAPRRLILSAQGVDAVQYTACAEEVLAVTTPSDIFGLGGWCILGRETKLLSVFWATLYQVLPMVKQAGVKDVHIFGVLYLPALGGLLWLADKYGLSISTDSTAPVMSCTRKDKKKAGVRAASGLWPDNVKWWQDTLANLRDTDYYREPPRIPPMRQGLLGLEELEEVS